MLSQVVLSSVSSRCCADGCYEVLLGNHFKRTPPLTADALFSMKHIVLQRCDWP
jgi:hypothetical protein